MNPDHPAEDEASSTDAPWPLDPQPARGDDVFVFSLFIAGMSPRSRRAVDNMTKLCDRYLAGRYELQVVDIYQQPELAQGEQLVAAADPDQEAPPPPAPVHRRPLGHRSSPGAPGHTPQTLAHRERECHGCQRGRSRGSPWPGRGPPLPARGGRGDPPRDPSRRGRCRGCARTWRRPGLHLPGGRSGLPPADRADERRRCDALPGGSDPLRQSPPRRDGQGPPGPRDRLLPGLVAGRGGPRDLRQAAGGGPVRAASRGTSA